MCRLAMCVSDKVRIIWQFCSQWGREWEIGDLFYVCCCDWLNMKIYSWNLLSPVAIAKVRLEKTDGQNNSFESITGQEPFTKHCLNWENFPAKGDDEDGKRVWFVRPELTATHNSEGSPHRPLWRLGNIWIFNASGFQYTSVQNSEWTLQWHS